MRVLLIYNPTAGDGVSSQLRELVDLIQAAGHEVLCRSSKDPLMKAALADPGDLVAVAGGDGTVIKVARALRGRKTAIAPLALGTANNIATALGLARSSLEARILGWSDARAIRIDVGMVRGPRGARAFLESFGAGLLPRLIDKRTGPSTDGDTDTRLARAVTCAREAAERLRPHRLQVALDGQDLSGRYVLLEAMNIGWAGPNLNLAAAADPADGQLDVVLVGEGERALLVECLRACERGESWPHALPTARGRCLRVARGDFMVHVDDHVWHAGRAAGEAQSAIEVSLGDSVRFLGPPAQPPARREAEAPSAPAESVARAAIKPRRWAWPAGRQARFRP
jgi:diacylglycerol kinase family enzyme